VSRIHRDGIASGCPILAADATWVRDPHPGAGTSVAVNPNRCSGSNGTAGEAGLTSVEAELGGGRLGPSEPLLVLQPDLRSCRSPETSGHAGGQSTDLSLANRGAYPATAMPRRPGLSPCNGRRCRRGGARGIFAMSRSRKRIAHPARSRTPPPRGGFPAVAGGRDCDIRWTIHNKSRTRAMRGCYRTPPHITGPNSPRHACLKSSPPPLVPSAPALRIRPVPVDRRG
jgi:hypothetical protein